MSESGRAVLLDERFLFQTLESLEFFSDLSFSKLTDPRIDRGAIALALQSNSTKYLSSTYFAWHDVSDALSTKHTRWVNEFQRKRKRREREREKEERFSHSRFSVIVNSSIFCLLKTITSRTLAEGIKWLVYGGWWRCPSERIKLGAVSISCPCFLTWCSESCQCVI